MPNMSYCRFRNTSNDMDDCLESLRDKETLSFEEKHACKRMFAEFFEFCHDEGIIEEDIVDVLERLEEYLERIEEE